MEIDHIDFKLTFSNEEIEEIAGKNITPEMLDSLETLINKKFAHDVRSNILVFMKELYEDKR